jgi:hypothetical protein
MSNSSPLHLRSANARHQRRARTAASDKPCMRDMLIARPLHAFVSRRVSRNYVFVLSTDNRLLNFINQEITAKGRVKANAKSRQLKIRPNAMASPSAFAAFVKTKMVENARITVRTLVLHSTAGDWRRLTPKPHQIANKMISARRKKKPISTSTDSQLTLAFSCGARSAFKLKEKGYLRNMLRAVSCKALLDCVLNCDAGLTYGTRCS